ncbi:hypothetical protein Tco_1083391 [Tanacetum coccineum]
MWYMMHFLEFNKVQNHCNCMLLLLSSELYARIQYEWNNDSDLQAKIRQLESNATCAKHYLWYGGELLRKGKLMISKDEMLRKYLLYHTTIKTTHFQVIYGQPPPAHIIDNKGDSLVEVVDRSLADREYVIQLLKFHIKRAHDRMKNLADKSGHKREFELEAWFNDRLITEEPLAVLDGKLAKKGNVAAIYVLL